MRERLTIGMDVAAARQPETGIGRHTAELVTALSADPDLRLVLFDNDRSGTAERRATSPPLPRAINPRLPSRALVAAWRYLRWPSIERFVGEVDVFHTSDWVHPPQRRGATVVPVHDLAALRHPEWYAPSVVAIHRRRLAEAVRQATMFVAVSNSTREDLISMFPVVRERVCVVPNGVSLRFAPVPPDDADFERVRLGLPKQFLLYVGSRERRKNLLGLIDIFALVADAKPDVGLALVGMRPWAEGARVHGADHWHGIEVERRIAALGLSSRVFVLGRLPFGSLLRLYTAAAALTFPSLYEGFGLPVAEAMACGTPVVASNRSALPEVVGDAGLLADPMDTREFAAQVLQILSDPALRQRCRDRGFERARSLRWTDAAARLKDVYVEAMRRRPRGPSQP